jgi:PAS domain S-box-containing protein
MPRVAEQIRDLSPEQADQVSPVEPNGVVNWSDPDAKTITAVDQFWTFTGSADRRVYPLRATFTVNYFDPDWHIMWVDWGGTGAYLEFSKSSPPPPLKTGQHVELSGFVCPSLQQILWDKTKIKLDEDFVSPPPLRVGGTVENPDGFDRRLVEVKGLVTQQTEADATHLRLEVVSDGWSIIAHVHLGIDEPVPQWLGAFVRLKGVFSVNHDWLPEAATYELWVDNPTYVTILYWLAEDRRFVTPTVPIEQIPSRPAGGLVHIKGAFQRAEPGKSITVRDSTGEIRVLTRQTQQLNKGDPIEAIGYPSGAGMGLALRQGLFRPLLGLVGEDSKRSLNLPKLRVAGQVRDLSPEEADRGYPVQLDGVVTWSDPDTRTFFLQDASGAVKVDLPTNGSIPTPEFKAGVRVFGLTRAGGYVSEVGARSVDPGAATLLPTSYPTTLEQAMTGVDYAHWVEMRGYVRAVKEEGRLTRLELTTASGDFVALAAGLIHPRSIEGALVRIRAVCDAIVNDRRELVGVQFLVPSPELVEVLEPKPADPFTTPIRSIRSLLEYGAANQMNRRVQVFGVVLLQDPGKLLYIRDGRDSLLVLSRQTDPLQIGDRVAVVGIPGHGGWRLMMRDASYRRLDSGPEPVATPLASIEPARTNLDGQLVLVRGRLIDISQEGAGERLQLESGNSIFGALLSHERFAGLEIGSDLELTGVYRVELDEYLQPRSFTVNLRSPGDIRVITLPPWWTSSRILWATAAILALGLLSVAWGLELSRKNRLLHEAQLELHRSNTELETRVVERTRDLRQEVAERQRSEAVLAEERRLLRTLIDNLPVHLYVKDTAGRFILSNLRHASVLGGAPGLPITGKTDFDIYPEPIARRYQADDRQVLETGEPLLNSEEPSGIGENAGWFSTTKVPLRDAAGKIVGLICISQDITARKHAEAEREFLHRKLMDASRQAGMAEVATSVLHNVGNVLNSVNVSATVVMDQVRRSEVESLTRASGLLTAHADDLAAFLTQDPRGRTLPSFFAMIASQLAAENAKVVAELGHLVKNVNHLNEVVSVQQSYAKTGGMTEVVRVVDLVEDAYYINSAALAHDKVEFIREYVDRPLVNTERHKIIQILVNLIHNAQHACKDSGRPDRKLIVRTSRVRGWAQIAVIDNGVGIPRENLTRIFNHGFTTRKDGHGFGLHSGSLTARELGGSLTAHSDGPGRGAQFTLELRAEPDAR